MIYLISPTTFGEITTIQATNKMQQLRFIDPFKSALHFSGANYAHPQELQRDRVPGRPHRRGIIPKAVNTVKVLLRMGVISARNM
jgi:hypothetical protein